MKKAITVKELINLLQTDYKDQMDCEVFVTTGDPKFYGVETATTLMTASNNKSYVALLALGDEIRV